jgi:stage II sporulation protein D
VVARYPLAHSMRVRLAPTACAFLTTVALVSAGHAPVSAADPPPGWVVDRVRFEPVASGGALTVEGSGAYRGAIDVVPAPGGLAVIDDVGVQDYLKGIAEMPPDWPVEALRAQAIAARTYLLNSRASTADSPWRAAGADICPTDACQVYAGVAGEQRSGAERWAAAVDDTAGQVLLYGGQPLRAMYSASNGGRTVSGGEPYLRPVSDPDDARSPLGHWHWAVPLATLAPVLGVSPPFVLTGVGRRGGTVVFATTAPDGTATPHELGAEDFRDRVNGSLGAPAGLPSALPSSNFTVSSNGASAIFDGRGFGHGVGMSQYGARGKALRGLTASDILAGYFAGIRPEVLAPDQMPATVRVALALGQRSVTVRPDRYFTVRLGSGEQLGGVELGRWRVQAAPGGVRVIPPAGREQPLTMKAATVDPTGETGPPVVHFDLTAPAVVTVRYVTPTGQPGSVPARVVDVGEVAQPLPPPGSGGDYQVLIEADGGPGRFVSVPLSLRVAGPRRVAIGTIGVRSTATGHGRAGWAALALLLAVAVALAGAHVSRRAGS